MIIASTAFCASCSKAPSATGYGAAGKKISSNVTPTRISEGAAYDIHWGKDGIGDASIPVQKGKPLFSVNVVDSGGAHCCQQVEVFNPVTSDIVFDSVWYGVDGRTRLVDLDGDGTVEIVQNLTSFHYYDALCYASSPWVDAIFTYDKEQHLFVPANDRFPALWNYTLDEARKRLPSPAKIADLGSAKNHNEFERIRELESEAVEKAANLILAGYEEEAYAWLERQFDQPEDGRRACNILRDHLKAEIYYQSVKSFRQGIGSYVDRTKREQ